MQDPGISQEDGDCRELGHLGSIHTLQVYNILDIYYRALDCVQREHLPKSELWALLKIMTAHVHESFLCVCQLVSITTGDTVIQYG